VWTGLINVNCSAVRSLVHLRKIRRYMFLPAFVCLSVCLWARLLKNACMDLDEMLRVDRCWDRDELINFWVRSPLYTVVQKNAPTLADYNCDPVQSILIIFRKLFVNDHKSCLVVKFSTSPHICCHYTLWNTMLYFALITLLRNAPTSDHHITSISVKEF